MKHSYRKIYFFEILKVMLISIFVLAFLVCVLWGCMFTTDYVMFKNNKATVFTKVSIEQTENGKITYEEGTFYYVLTNEKEQKTFYLFNNRID